MTRLNFLMPRLAQPIRIVSQVLKIVFPVMGWLAKVMTRREKVRGFFAGVLQWHLLRAGACRVQYITGCAAGRVQFIKYLCEDRRFGDEREAG